MTRARWTRVKRIFKAALDVPAHERDALLDRECGGDIELRCEAASLLASLDNAPVGFLAGPAMLAADAGDVDDALMPKHAGPCSLIGPLGTAGLAEAWLAELVEERAWAPLGTRVLVKLVRQGPGQETALRRLQREERLGRETTHPALVRAFESGHAGDGEHRVDWLILEQVDGKAVADLMSDLGQVPEPLLREIASCVAGALAALHERGIVHRDVRPSTVFLTPDHQVRLGSLGAAFVAGEPRITGDGDIVAPARHAAPEILEGREPTTEADVHALGALVHEAATGAPAFPGTDLLTILRCQLAARPPRLRALVPSISVLLDDLVARMLAREPSDRPSAARVAALLIEDAGHDST